jgi:hypothetical protein
LDFAGGIIFSQSFMAPAASSSCADAMPRCADVDRAAGELRGVTTSDKAIRSARM